MSRSLAIVLGLSLLAPVGVRAEEDLRPALIIPDAVYKGAVGKALDAVPMDPEQRATLQRTNAVVSSTMTARSLSVWIGLATNPILLVGGLIWGIYAASNIKADATRPKADTTLAATGIEAARYHHMIPANDTPAERVSEGDE